MFRILRIAALSLVMASPAFASQATLVTPGSPLPMTSLAAFLNSAFLSIGSCNSGNSAPANGTGAVAFAGECWINTTANPWVFSYTADGTHWSEFGTLNTSSYVWTPYGSGAAALISSNNLSDVASAPTAFANIVQPSAASALGGVKSLTCAAHNWFSALSTLGAFSCAQPAVGDISGGAALSSTSDTNVTIALGGTPASALLAATSITMGWSGTLAAARLNANVVQAVTNDTNVTGAIAAQNLTLGWAGTLAVARGGTGGGTASGTLLDNITGFSSTGFLTRTGAGTYAFQSTTNGITNGNLAQGAAATLKGNPTASTANLQDFTVQGLTNATPNATLDYFLFYNHTTGTLESATASQITTAVGSGVTSFNGRTGAVVPANGDYATTNLSDVTGPTSYSPTDASGASLTFTSVTGLYTRIGKTVTLQFRLTYPSTANGSNASVTIPVGTNASLSSAGGGTAAGSCLGPATIVAPVVLNSASTLQFSGTSSLYTNANLSGLTLVCEIHYISS